MYLFMRDTEREAETPVEGEAGSLQGARRGTRSRDPRIMLRAEGGANPPEPLRDPLTLLIELCSPLPGLSGLL